MDDTSLQYLILDCFDYCSRKHTDIGHAHSTPAGTNQDDTQQQKEGMHLCVLYSYRLHTIIL